MTLRNPPGVNRQQGYTLPELAIVLGIMIMIAAIAAWNLADRFRVDQDKGTSGYMDSLHEAVIAYSIDNTTVGADVVYGMQGSTSTVTVHAPAGRPVLPCPDLDGDGYEDRHVDDPAVSVATVTVSIRLNGDTWWADLQETPLRCVDNKGLLPWRTLKVEPSDYWGQHFTYWVDLNLANGIYGFDQTTKASTIFKHFVVLVPEQARVFRYVIQNSTGARPTNPNRRYHYAPGVILEFRPNSSTYEVHAGEVFDAGSTAHKGLVEQRRINSADGPEVQVIEYAMIDPAAPTTGVVSVPVSPLTGNLPFVSNGIAFAIVSHGKNGLGGRIYRSTRDPATDFTCNPFSDYASMDNIEEKLNARLEYPCEQATPGSCSAGNAAGCQTDDRPSGVFFVSQRTFLDENENVDDIVSWMHTGSVVNRLSQDGVLPLPLPPVGFIYQP